MLLEKLTAACGLPGFEGEVRDIIRAELEGVCELREDNIGNLFATKNPSAKGPRYALAAHMDEVGLCIRGIDANGYLKFVSWGVDQRLLPSMRVLVGNDKIPGAIGCKPIHLQKDSERGSAYEIDAMYIDIGCDKKEEAEKLVSAGDFAAFDSKFALFGEHRVKAKSLDDRVGCAAIIEVLKMDLPHSLTGVFCAQEEIGMRGSAVAAKSLAADVVINIEGTICADTDGVKPHEQVTTQGAGPCLSIMDGTSIYRKSYLEAIAAAAEKNGIPYQYRRTGMGGTDSFNFHTQGGGIPCIGIAVPCRYIHSPVSVMHMHDYENLVRLIAAYIKEGVVSK